MNGSFLVVKIVKTYSPIWGDDDDSEGSQSFFFLLASRRVKCLFLGFSFKGAFVFAAVVRCRSVALSRGLFLFSVSSFHHRSSLLAYFLLLYRVHTKRGEKRWHGKVGEQCVKIVCTVNDARESVVWRNKGNGKGEANGLKRNTVTGREIIIKYQHTSALLQRAAQWVIEKVRKFAQKEKKLRAKIRLFTGKLVPFFFLRVLVNESVKSKIHTRNYWRECAPLKEKKTKERGFSQATKRKKEAYGSKTKESLLLYDFRSVRKFGEGEAQKAKKESPKRK